MCFLCECATVAIFSSPRCSHCPFDLASRASIHTHTRVKHGRPCCRPQGAKAASVHTTQHSERATQAASQTAAGHATTKCHCWHARCARECHVREASAGVCANSVLTGIARCSLWPAWLARPGTTLAPLPATRRGYGIVLNSSPKDQKIVYTNGRLVIVRSLAVRQHTRTQADTAKGSGRYERAGGEQLRGRRDVAVAACL